ncbi:hypothetical protein EIN_285020 [Entamoeba invadens IP1]|uniref:Uncharacterized protein n=1 Tax=Entamoeba invadens IP1 TaxID=370355 RepID=L7FJW5_ENTIV|nr:hypothetical protein EIN_285020 [Entamoeba invadens IP1]ELP84916.1 hypothetical protein EIN_285020 [Entamoeba invadens IP1]|eukprot:XP_004184262.1 hypothetical protein EIN_285020 [Entamoeba invadens IP1]
MQDSNINKRFEEFRNYFTFELKTQLPENRLREFHYCIFCGKMFNRRKYMKHSMEAKLEETNKFKSINNFKFFDENFDKFNLIALNSQLVEEEKNKSSGLTDNEIDLSPNIYRGADLLKVRNELESQLRQTSYTTFEDVKKYLLKGLEETVRVLPLINYQNFQMNISVLHSESTQEALDNISKSFDVPIINCEDVVSKNSTGIVDSGTLLKTPAITNCIPTPPTIQTRNATHVDYSQATENESQNTNDSTKEEIKFTVFEIEQLEKMKHIKELLRPENKYSAEYIAQETNKEVQRRLGKNIDSYSTTNDAGNERGSFITMMAALMMGACGLTNNQIDTMSKLISIILLMSNVPKKQCDYYTLMADSAMYNGVEYFSLFVRFVFSDGSFVEKRVKIVNYDGKTDAAGWLSWIMKILELMDADLIKCIGACFDGAYVLIRNGGLSGKLLAKIKERDGLNGFDSNYCFSHRTNKATEKCFGSQWGLAIESFLDGLTVQTTRTAWDQFCAKNHIKGAVLKLVQRSETRWLQTVLILDNMFENLPSLQEFYSEREQYQKPFGPRNIMGECNVNCKLFVACMFFTQIVLSKVKIIDDWLQTANLLYPWPINVLKI